VSALIELIQGVLHGQSLNLTGIQWMSLGARLLPVVPELLNLPADYHLSPEARLKIQDVVAEFEKEIL
jgi:hypothetical protein